MAKKIFDWKLLEAEQFTVFDIETTGFSPAKGAKIIEIGAVKVVNMQIVESFHEYINPECRIPEKITELTGINQNMVKNAQVFRIVLPEFYEFMKDTTVVAHNAMFDWDRFLLYFYPMIGIQANNLCIDTQLISKTMFAEYKKHGLKDLCAYLEVPMTGHHQALTDATLTAQCLINAMKQNLDKFIPKTIDLDTLKKREIKEEVPIQILSENTWIKGAFKRVYFKIKQADNKGTVYFDIPTKSWGVKEFGDLSQNVSVSMKQVEKTVLAKHNLESIDKLSEFFEEKLKVG